MHETEEKNEINSRHSIIVKSPSAFAVKIWSESCIILIISSTSHVSMLPRTISLLLMVVKPETLNFLWIKENEENLCKMGLMY